VEEIWGGNSGLGVGKNAREVDGAYFALKESSWAVVANGWALPKGCFGMDTNSCAMGGSSSAINANSCAIDTGSFGLDANSCAISANSSAINANSCAINLNSSAIVQNSSAISVCWENGEMRGWAVGENKVRQKLNPNIFFHV
jgi:hypothetical protein